MIEHKHLGTSSTVKAAAIVRHTFFGRVKSRQGLDLVGSKNYFFLRIPFFRIILYLHFLTSLFVTFPKSAFPGQPSERCEKISHVQISFCPQKNTQFGHQSQGDRWTERSVVCSLLHDVFDTHTHKAWKKLRICKSLYAKWREVKQIRQAKGDLNFGRGGGRGYFSWVT